MLEFKGDFIDGKFFIPRRVDASFAKVSPADLDEKILEVQVGYDNVEEAVAAARKAYEKWSALKLEDRANHLKKLADVFQARSEDLATMISREVGKPLWEAKTEAAALVGKIKITLTESLKQIEAVKLENVLPNVTGFVRYQSRGVMAVLGPFNFPVHLPNGHIIPALIAGNTVVFKPSDKTPGIGQLYTECFAQAEFPAGVYNMVQGDATSGRKLAASEYVDGVLFTGSYDVGLKIKQETLHHYWKILALEMGGKNCSIVWKDSDLKKALYENLVGAFLTTGQRCSCTSKILVHKSLASEFIDKYYEAAKKIKVDHWTKNPFCGPLISKESVESYLRFQEIAKREKAEPIMRGKAIERDKKGFYVTPSINRIEAFDKKSVYQNSEIFGPNVGILEIDDIEQALSVVNSSGYGLVASLFSKDAGIIEHVRQRARVGVLNLNRATNGSSSRLPFGGQGKSGNDRASGSFAINYCVVPVAEHVDDSPFDPGNAVPGLEINF